MTDKLEQAARQALEALEKHGIALHDDHVPAYAAAIAALREALQELENKNEQSTS